VTKDVIKETLAYTVEEFAAYTGYGRTTIDEAIARGDLIARYANQKGVIDIEEGRRWIRSLDTERPPRKAGV
jgi:hypothetical protein